MTATALLHNTIASGIVITIDNGLLVIESEGEHDIPDDLVELLRFYKAEIIAILTAKKENRSSDEPDLHERIAEIEAELRHHPLWHQTVNTDWFSQWRAHVLRLQAAGDANRVQMEFASISHAFQKPRKGESDALDQ